MAMASSPEAQKRLIVAPATLIGRPARSAAIRAPFSPCSSSGWAQPRIRSSMASGSIPALSTAALMAMAARSSGLVFLSVPRGDFPIAVLAALTITMSLIMNSIAPLHPLQGIGEDQNAVIQQLPQGRLDQPLPRTSSRHPCISTFAALPHARRALGLPLFPSHNSKPRISSLARQNRFDSLQTSLRSISSSNLPALLLQIREDKGL